MFCYGSQVGGPLAPPQDHILNVDSYMKFSVESDFSR